MDPVIGVVVALPSELRALAGSARSDTEIKGRILRVSPPGSIRFLYAQCGIGIERARSAAVRLVEEGASALASVGLSGGLGPDLSPGDLIVADAVLEAGPAGLETVGSPDPSASEQVRRSLASAGLSAVTGAVVCSGRPVLESEDKNSLYKRSGALAVDMESSGVARAATETNRPFLCVRAVCDPAGRTVSGELFSVMDPSGRIRTASVLIRLIKRPSLLVEMLASRKEYATALDALRRAWAVQSKSGMAEWIVSGG
jgi:adenosylhomocysteine nucleosidase